MSQYSKDQNQFRHLWMEGYEFKLGHYIREGFHTLKSYPFGFLGHVLLSIIAVSLLGIFSFFAAAMLVAAINGGFAASSVIGIITLTLVGWFISAFFYSFLSGAFYVAREYNMQGRRNFDSFFKGFSHFGQIFLFTATYGLITTIISFIAMKVVHFEFPMPDLDSLTSGDPESLMIYAEEFSQQLMQPQFIQQMSAYSGLAGLLSLYFSVAWSFSLPMIVLKNMRFWEAMESSRKIITRRWFNFLGFYIVLGILMMFSIVGVSLLGGYLAELIDSDIISFLVGMLILFTVMLIIPYYFLAQYAAFEDIVLIEEGYDDMIDDIGGDDDEDMKH